MINCGRLPLCPHTQQCHNPESEFSSRFGLVRSWWNGHRPTSSLPTSVTSRSNAVAIRSTSILRWSRSFFLIGILGEPVAVGHYFRDLAYVDVQVKPESLPILTKAVLGDEHTQLALVQPQTQHTVTVPTQVVRVCDLIQTWG